MKRRDMKLLLEERFERIALLETRIDTMDQLVEGYRAREQAIFDTLQTAKESAAKLLEQAQADGAQVRAEAEAVLADAQSVRANARAEAEALLSDAINTANQLKTEAERRGNEVSASIKADSERMLRDAEIIKREYEEMVESFNAMLEQNASELEVTAARFAEFVKNRKIDHNEVRLDGNAFYKSVGEMNDANLPDASDDPSRLMQNIYRIQNRPLPEDRTEAAVHEAAAQTDNAAEPKAQTDAQIGDTTGRTTEFFEGTASQTQQPPAEEPYSEAAWVNETGESKTEPQAEFVQAFDGAYVKSDYSVRAECAVTQEDAVSAFDALVSGEEAATNILMRRLSPAAKPRRTKCRRNRRKAPKAPCPLLQQHRKQPPHRSRILKRHGHKAPLRANMSHRRRVRCLVPAPMRQNLSRRKQLSRM